MIKVNRVIITSNAQMLNKISDVLLKAVPNSSYNSSNNLLKSLLKKLQLKILNIEPSPTISLKLSLKGWTTPKILFNASIELFLIIIKDSLNFVLFFSISEINSSFDEIHLLIEVKYDSIISCSKLKKEIKENKYLKIFLEQSEKYDELFPLFSEYIRRRSELFSQ